MEMVYPLRDTSSSGIGCAIYTAKVACQGKLRVDGYYLLLKKAKDSRRTTSVS